MLGHFWSFLCVHNAAWFTNPYKWHRVHYGYSKLSCLDTNLKRCIVGFHEQHSKTIKTTVIWPESALLFALFLNLYKQQSPLWVLWGFRVFCTVVWGMNCRQKDPSAGRSLNKTSRSKQTGRERGNTRRKQTCRSQTDMDRANKSAVQDQTKYKDSVVLRIMGSVVCVSGHREVLRRENGRYIVCILCVCVSVSLHDLFVLLLECSSRSRHTAPPHLL